MNRYNNNNIITKSEKREKESKALKSKRIKHSYGDFGEKILEKQITGISKKLKKIIKEKINIK